MNYNLKEFIMSFKLNISQFEELAFAGSNLSMSKKEFNNILFAEEIHDQASDSKETIADAYIEIEEKKETLLSKITKKISDFFKRKPEVYTLGDGESLELDGSVPGNPVGGFLGKIGAAIEKFTSKRKYIREATKVTNQPQIISNHLAVRNQAKERTAPSLLDEGTPQINPDIVIPTEVTGTKRQPQGSYIQSAPAPTSTMTVEEIKMDEDAVTFIGDNKESISKVVDSLTSDKTTVQEQKTTPIEPAQPVQDKDDDYTK